MKPGSESAKVRKVTSGRWDSSSLDQVSNCRVNPSTCMCRPHTRVYALWPAGDGQAGGVITCKFLPTQALLGPSLRAREGGTGILTPFRWFSFTVSSYVRASAAAFGKLECKCPESKRLRLWGPWDLVPLPGSAVSAQSRRRPSRE